jgi:hypothetical protein
MTAHEISNAPRSRRALLGGLLGGVGVWAASMVSRAVPAEAAAGDPILMGRLNKAGGTSTELQTSTSKPAFWARQLGGGHAVRAEAETGRAVMALAGHNGTGVWAYSPNNIAVRATTLTGSALQAFGENGIGIYAESVRSDALRAVSYDGYAGRFNGRLRVTGYQDLLEIRDPGAPPGYPPMSSDGATVRFFARDNGSGKSQLCVRFKSGAVQVIATEP